MLAHKTSLNTFLAEITVRLFYDQNRIKLKLKKKKDIQKIHRY